MYYGFDIGGSKIAFGAYDSARQLCMETRIATPHSGYQTFLDAIVDLVAQADKRFGCKGSVGIGIPGVPDTGDGTLYAANLPAATGHTLRADLSVSLQRPVRIDNDANCFVLSEATDDEFQGLSVILGLILGTGVGGGIIANGRPVTGHRYITGEFGHTRLPVDALEVLGWNIPLLPCGCGNRGCAENYLSGRGFAWLYEHVYHQALSAPEIIARWEQGERNALAHVERFVALLAVCLGNWLTVVDADVVVLGGGLSRFSALTTLLPAQLAGHLLPAATVPRIIQARYGDAGGMRGAAFLHLTE